MSSFHKTFNNFTQVRHDQEVQTSKLLKLSIYESPSQNFTQVRHEPGEEHLRIQSERIDKVSQDSDWFKTQVEESYQNYQSSPE